MKRFGVINHESGYSFEGYTMKQLEEEILPAWEMNAEAVGEDLGGITGDLAIGPAMVRDMVARIKELEAQFATQNP